MHMDLLPTLLVISLLGWVATIFGGFVFLHLRRRGKQQETLDALNQRLISLEEQYATVSQLSTDFVYVCTLQPSGMVSYHWVTDAITQITGYTSQEIEALGDWKKMVMRDDFDRAMKRDRDLFDLRETTVTYRIQSKTGGIRWVRDFSRPQRLENSELIMVYGVMYDISEAQIATELTTLAEERSAVLDKVAHELIVPLKTMDTFVDVLDNEAYGTLNKTQRDVITEINTNLHYLQRLVEELTAPNAKTLSNLTQPHTAPFSPQELLQRIAFTIGMNAADAGIEFQTQLDDALPPHIYGDEQRLYQISTNLITHVLKMTHAGTVTLHMFTGAPNQWTLEVQETDSELSLGKYRAIDNFLHNRVNIDDPPIEGSELGLTIVREQASALGQKVSFTSEGKGGRYTLTMPLKAVLADEKQT